ncbi:MAG: hypothetical protein A2991_00080 [Candidatus Terrybacteria bacterium RIFCSPLOWO2_01_FULL_58_14]|uniref:Peptidoglycan recognition protein family domain-containing protein n=1 Tax=Candidatus Terrybacteria bacterium RIFCSPLOWO2_01_FULL_58_14 TaxID=1802369 RepID=A0A1G2PYJ6_9BACT|nr:MAG: hypothetical protein A2991_00080 [Candidatus Terrybacteria bacterium RIFCSPLOWO2_01_FULL_58_14]
MGARDRSRFLIAAIAVAFFLLGAFGIAFAQNEGEADVTVPTGTDALPPGVTNETIYEGNGVPRIYARGTWEGFEFFGGVWQPTEGLRNLLRWLPQPDNQPPDYNAVERIIVHDQGCVNPTACIANAEKFPIQTIQGVYRSHAVTRGWGDIGYNYIIDRQGRIYEGRYGGNGVRAAHIYADARCENLNVGSAGVLLLGDLRGGPMTSAQSESLARLAGWLGATNGVDFSEVSATTTTWRNPGSGGQCDLTQGGFTGSLTAARLVSHGDVEPGNSDYFDLSPQRILAETFSAQFSAFAYQSDANAPAYFIRDGALHEASSGSAMLQIDSAQLALFPRASAAALPDGTLVKSPTRSRVYVIESGKRRPVPTADLFVARGYQWEAIQTIADRELALIRLGAPVPYLDSALVKGSGQDVFVFEGGSLRHVTSAALFSALKYVWTSIRTLLDQDIEQYPKGEPKTFPDGTLVKSPAPRVYRIEGGARRAVLSAQLFSSLKFSWSEIKQLSDEELGRYPEGTALAWPDGALLRGEGQERVYLIQQGYRRWIQTAEAFREFGYRWQDIRIVALEEILSAPEAQPIANQSDRNLLPQPWNPPAPEPVINNPPLAPTTEEEPLMRIGLSVIGADKHPGTLVGVSYDSGAAVKQNGAVLATLTPGQQYSFTPSADTTWRIEPATSQGIATVSTYTDLGWAASGTPPPNDNRFRGVIEVKAASDGTTFWLINELLMEQYLKGIAETINGDPVEYGKAFVIAARSYALYHYQGGGKRAGEPFVIRRTSADQLYKGYNFELRAADPVAAVNATRGIVAMFNGKPILAAYSSGAPGPTKSACEALSSAFCNNADFAYLNGGVNDPADTLYQNGAICGVSGNHCAGMDAAGARRMAELGSSYADILVRYYPGSAPISRWE